MSVASISADYLRSRSDVWRPALKILRDTGDIVAVNVAVARAHSRGLLTRLRDALRSLL